MDQPANGFAAIISAAVMTSSGEIGFGRIHNCWYVQLRWIVHYQFGAPAADLPSCSDYGCESGQFLLARTVRTYFSSAWHVVLV